MPQLSITEQMLYATLKLTTFKGDAQLGSATGFFYRVDVDGERSVQLIVTNKHVLADCNNVALVCHVSAGGTPPTPSGNHRICWATFEEDSRIDHPDPDVDLCALPFSSILNQAKSDGYPLFLVTMTKENIPQADDWENFDAIEEVVMVGCPHGLYDEANNLPIFRRGVTASALPKRYGGKDQFMVDMACFPGSSGSPIFIHDRGAYFNSRTNALQLGGRGRFYLLGVLFAGPTITNSGQIVMAQPPRVEVTSMMHLGYALRSTALLVFEELVRARISQAADPGAA